MKKVVIEIISCLFIVLFVYAAFTKLMDYQKFTVQIGQSPLLMAFSGWIAWMVPTVEILIALMLSFSKFRLVGMYAAFTLMTMFTVYIVMILNFADHVPCSCGGILEKLGWTEHLIFNISFVLLALVGIVLLVKKDESEVHALVA